MLVPRQWIRNGWTPGRWAAAAGLTLLGAVATWDAWADMLRIAARDEESSHAFLVPVIVAWLCWLRRGRLRQCRPDGFWVGTGIVACGWAMYSLGDTLLFQSAWHAGAIMVAVGCALTVLGRDLLLKFLPAFVALAFIVPVPGRIRQRVAIPLEAATARVTQQVLLVAGSPVERSGNVLTINGVDVAVAEACNGLRMVFALTLVSYGFAFGTPLRSRTRAIILLASPVSAITCNVVRLVPTVWLYGHPTGTHAEGFHNAAGWVMLGVSFLVLMGLVQLLRWAMVPVGPYTLARD